MHPLYLVLLILAAIAFVLVCYFAIHPRPAPRSPLVLFFLGLGLVLWELVDLIRTAKT